MCWLASGPLTAGAPGLDRLLDQVKVNVLPDGSVQISSVAGASSDTPAQLQLSPGVAPQASDKASLPSTATLPQHWPPAWPPSTGAFP